MSEGKKYDTGKPRWSLLPEGAVSSIVAVLEAGAQKYSENNWQLVPNGKTRYYDAAMRHIEAWRNGELNDPETGLPHLSHAGCCLMFLGWLDGQRAKINVPECEPEWIEWKGGACPVQPSQKVEIRIRSGDIHTGAAGVWDWYWVKGVHRASDILRYRVISEAKNEWIEWKGGKRPVGADVMVLLRFFSGSLLDEPEKAGEFSWDISNKYGSIVAYKVVK